MKKQTPEEIVRLISEEEMSPDDVRNIMMAIRKQDAVAGDIVVCIDDVDDIIYKKAAREARSFRCGMDSTPSFYGTDCYRCFSTEGDTICNSSKGSHRRLEML